VRPILHQGITRSVGLRHDATHVGLSDVARGRFRNVLRVTQLVREGARLIDQGRLDEALASYAGALQIDPKVPEAWFDIGLIHKRRRDWRACLDANIRVVELRSGPGEPAWWNAGIAATALREWSTARKAWAEYGLDIPSGEGPLELDYGPCPVRLWPDRVGEVVWGVRIDPCRVVIEASVPLPESGHRWRDVVLHDGVPVGSRVFHGRELAVFDELDVWSTSTEVTIELIAPGIGEADFQALLDAAISQDCICENWSSSIRWICEECSTGQPNATHKHPEIAEGENRIALAGERDRLVELVRAWSSTRPHLDVTVSTVLE
jgi:TPR repeat